MARRRKQHPDPKQTHFFDEPPRYLESDPTFKPFDYPVWTRNKARLVQRYLRYFVFITKHGTYIDGFAGPQEPNKPETWAASLVYRSQPPWLRHFFLCEIDESKLAALNEIKENAERVSRLPRRLVEVFPGDFNTSIGRVLSSDIITESEATFCLLDQRTFECDWQTVTKIARHKSSSKIELFYFLGTGWLHRAFSGLKKEPEDRMTRWWGRDDWHRLKDSGARSITDTVVKRFKAELGYRYANAFPIYEHDEGTTKAMYQMIHASDHPEAPKLMARAYRNAVHPEEPPEQLEIEIGARE